NVQLAELDRRLQLIEQDRVGLLIDDRLQQRIVDRHHADGLAFVIMNDLFDGCDLHQRAVTRYMRYQSLPMTIFLQLAASDRSFRLAPSGWQDVGDCSAEPLLAGPA